MSNHPRAAAVQGVASIALSESVREPVVQSIRATKIRPQHRERLAIVLCLIDRVVVHVKQNSERVHDCHLE